MKCRICKKKIDKGDDYVRANLSYVCAGDCADEFIQKHIEKSRNKKRIKQNKRRTKMSPLMQTQKVFNRYIRVRDAVPNGKCISCPRLIICGSPTCHAGHFYSRGARSDLRFNENNVFGQCQNCNNYGDAETAVKFKEAVIEKIGQKEFDKLSVSTQQDYSEKALKKLRIHFNKKIKKLEK